MVPRCSEMCRWRTRGVIAVERLSGLDAMFLYLETTDQPSNICCAIELNTSPMRGGYSPDALQRSLAATLALVPELRQKVEDSHLNLDHPVWVDDPSFDVDQHLFRQSVTAPGGREQIAELCADIAARPLDRDKPLWEMWILENAASSHHVTLVFKAHHALVDGVAGANLLAKLCTPDPRAQTSEHLPRRSADAGLARMVVSGAVGAALRPWRLTTIVPATGLTVVRTLRRARSGKSMAAPFSAPRTPFNAPFSQRRNVAFATVDLDDVKKIKNRFNVTVNDVVMAVCAGALRQFLADRAELPTSPLIAAVPVSVHGRSDRPGRNQTSWMFCSLRTETADPVSRLRTMANGAAMAKQHSADLGATLLQDWAQLLSSAAMSVLKRVVSRIPKLPSPAFNLILSNVAGPAMPLYMAEGCEVTRLHPLGPILMGSGLNITVMSYNGSVGVGLISSPDLVPDLWSLADAIPTALEELLAEDRA